MIRVWAILITLLPLMLATAVADAPSPRPAANRGLQSQLPTPQQTGSTVTIDPSSFDLSKQVEQMKKLDGDIATLKAYLEEGGKEGDVKKRIAKLRDLLRDVTQLKLILISLDATLSQRRESANREASTIRQLLSSIPTRGSLGPNLSAEQLSYELNGDYNDLAKVNSEISQNRAALKALAGAAGEQLSMIDSLHPINPFHFENRGPRLDQIRSYVGSILPSDPQSYDVGPTPVAPQQTLDSDNASEKSGDLPAQKDSGPQLPVRMDSNSQGSVYEKAVQIAARLYQNLNTARQINNLIDYIENIRDNRKRLDDYRLVDARIGDMREQISILQAKVAGFQDAINQSIDTSINQIGGRDWFTLWATGIFGLAVVIVIGSFFALAFRDKDNRFLVNPDIGLQFVTLFSIIIAIILFGVLNILEGKELSALLGGIAGYILGRGTLGSRESKSDLEVERHSRSPSGDSPPGRPA